MATRQQIRASIRTLIAGFFTSAFDYRPGQLFDDELPCASTYFESGESQRDFDDDAETTAQLAIEILARTSGTPDTELDALARQVEQAIRADNTLGGLVDQVVRTGFQYDRDPESLDASLTLYFKVQYTDED
ncbi:hypothetical protein GCM10011369_23420 [Neiella marina]|uniref:Uncharacterized protein n=1 Tax=Neiella marina TaxID=508461 RepID=A0A8J2U5S5_9GAMM|nr:phage tail terminator protein [Neiella marina]GGA80777.1 hypothetical protein GCM10011369_23420 [Neiella marina]